MTNQELYRAKLGTVENCLDLLQSNDVIAVAGAACEPFTFITHIGDAVRSLQNVTMVKSKDNHYDYLTDESLRGHIFTVSHLFHTDLRKAQEMRLAAYIPSDLSTFSTIRCAVAPNNVFVAQVSDMDEDGNFCIPYCQMFEKEQLACAKTVILEVNPAFRPVRGGLKIHIRDVAKFFVSPKEPLTIPREEPTETDKVIGDYIAQFIHDGDTIQLGIGRLPDAVAVRLKEKNDLGLHTEMFTSNMLGLVRDGNITGKYKTVDPGEHVGAFALGDLDLYRTLSDMPSCRIAASSYVNDPAVIARQDNMKSVNTCLEIDLMGQVASESIGPRQFSGTGGAADFASGALRSKGGRGIIAFNSTTKNGTISKIKPLLTPGAAVTISRNLVDTVITEFGVAELKGRTVPERAMALISIAHPDFRDSLLEDAKTYGFI
ncbi:acetyl-CoA hydrolase/transferase family protein [Dysosmobacter sp.]|uniref:acetyl-CoA hydrolase/transferase family protein n=1 Tax=Dysosmobacter sp. TaxID=2591382 RepID=UPI003AEFAB16